MTFWLIQNNSTIPVSTRTSFEICRGRNVLISVKHPIHLHVRDSNLPTPQVRIITDSHSFSGSFQGHDILILGASPPLANPIAYNTLRPYDPATGESHFFHTLKQDSADCFPDGPTLEGNNPTRRDTTQLPAWGWLVVAFETNNPGAWLFHCHTAWHVSQGLSVQFLEQLAAIPRAMDLSTLAPTCNAWNEYYPANDPYRQDGSGI
jgi:FtsP/CotA-like multicopper oxidase with cupredoxin domain